MSPTLFREKGYRFYFLSNDEIIKAWQAHFGKRWKYYPFWALAFHKRKGMFFKL
jgi:hypothetical protein